LATQRDRAMLFKDLATLRVDRSLLAAAEQLHWHGPTGDFAAVCQRIDAGGVAGRAERLAATRS
jgi:hypothetical protein